MALQIANATVRIADILPPSGVSLEGIQAKNVTFIGPAILLVHGDITFAGNTHIGGDPEGILWDIPDHRSTVTGAIDIKNAHFEDCSLMMIGFAGKHDMLAQLIGGAHVPPPTT